ncbi:PR domain zinc finger protein 13, partial [Saguinus oedipus]
DLAHQSACLAAAAAATMHATARAPATSVSADCCIPAGLRLGPVPGTFKLGKYLSDRREPGPKKKVLAIQTSALRGSPQSPDPGKE